MYKRQAQDLPEDERDLSPYPNEAVSQAIREFVANGNMAFICKMCIRDRLSAERAKLVAYDLLCRKALKIKSSALAQIFRSVDKECDTKAMRDELIACLLYTSPRTISRTAKTSCRPLVAATETAAVVAVAGMVPKKP